MLEEGGEALQGRPSVQKRRLALLAVLATASGRSLSRSRATTLVWPEKDEERARRLLVQAAYDIRKDLGVDAITSRGDDVVLDTLHVRSDVDDFEAALERGDFDAAVELYRGPFLDGFVLDGSVEFEHWVDAERSRLARLHMRALTARAEALEAADDRVGAAEAWGRAANADRLDSRVALRYLLALDAAGNRAGALKFAGIHAQLLDAELGIEPAPEFAAAVERIRDRKEAVPVPPRPAPPAVVSKAEASPPESRPDRKRGHRSDADPGPVRVPAPGTAWRGVLVVAVLLVVAGGGGYVMSYMTGQETGEHPGQTDIVRVAVVPFTTPDSSDLPFADGLASQILTVLANVPGVSTPAWSAAVTVRGADVREAAERLGVDYVLEGRVHRDGDSLRMAVELSGRDGFSLATRTYDRPAGMFKVWDEIALAVLEDVRPALAEQGIVTQGGSTDNHDAYDLFSKGRSAWLRRDPGALETAIAYHTQALQLDSGFARAHVGLADAYNIMGAYGYGVMAPEVAFPMALEHAREAVRLAPDLGEAYAALANALFAYNRDFAGADAAYRKAIELDPSYAEAHHWYSLFLLTRGQEEESMERARQALALDSLSAVMRTGVAQHHYFRGQPREALRNYRLALDRDPSFVTAHLGTGIALLEVDSTDAAIASFEQALDLTGRKHVLSRALIGHSLGLAGRSDSARAILVRLEAARDSGRWVAPEYFALVHLGLGDHDTAIAQFEEALESGSSAVPFFGLFPLARDVWDDPRFKALIARGQEPVRRSVSAGSP